MPGAEVRGGDGPFGVVTLFWAMSSSTDTSTHPSNAVMQTAPLLPVAVGFVVGIVFDRFVCPPPLGVIGSFVLASLALALHRRRATLAAWLVFLVSVCVGGTLHYGAARRLPATSIERHTQPLRRLARLSGTVASPPRLLSPPLTPFSRWNFRSERTVLLLDVEAIAGIDGAIPTSGRVRVSVNDTVLNLREGERVELWGWLRRLTPPRNPGSFDWAGFFRRQGIVAAFSCDHRQNVRRLSDPTPSSAGPVAWLRGKARSMLIDDLATGSDAEASLLSAMVLGHRSKLDRKLNELFIRAGCIHFLAVSGLHVAIVMVFVRLICRLLLVSPRAGRWAMLGAVLLYAVVAEPRPSILRATVIATLFCLATLLGRARARLNWIAAAVVLLALFDPDMVFDVGYQLSFAAVLGVIYLTPTMADALRSIRSMWRHRGGGAAYDAIAGDDATRWQPIDPKVGTLRRTARWGGRALGMALLVSTGAWLASLPVAATHFQTIHPWAPVNSVLVVPLVMIVMGLGFFKVLVGAIAPSLATFVGIVLTTVDSSLIGMVEHLAALPGASIHVPTPPWWLVAGYYLLLLSLVGWFFQSRGRRARSTKDGSLAEPPRSPWLARGCVASFVLLLTLAALWQGSHGRRDRLLVTVLSVGAGSATVIELPDGSTILYDVGSSSPYDVGVSTVVPYLRHRSIRRIDRVYLSHPNLDHFSGVPSLIDQIPTGPVVINEHFVPHSEVGSPSRQLLDLLAADRHPIETQAASATRWMLGGVSFERLSPESGKETPVLTNDTSTVLRLSYLGHSVLLTGDIENQAQRLLLARGGLAADVLLLPHHGSVRSSSAAFIEAVSPGFVVRSSHQRTGETLNGLSAILGAARLFNTADVGAVCISLDRNGVEVSACRQ